MYRDTTCVILKTSNNGRDGYRVAIVQNFEQMRVGNPNDYNSLKYFFDFVGSYFCRITPQHIEENLAGSLIKRVCTPTEGAWAAQTLSQILHKYGRLKVFDTNEDALLEAKCLNDEFEVDYGLPVEYGTINVDMTISIVINISR